MSPRGLCLVSLAFCFLRLTAAFPRSCKDDEYTHADTCCKHCPAGQRVASHCSAAGGERVCEECQDGTFTEHANGLTQCFRCAQCRPDQEVVRRCSHTQQSECRCRAGRFCSPEEACEVCRRCSSCAPGEETVRNCTSTANTECKKNAPTSNPDSEKAVWIVPLVVTAMAAALIIAGIIFAMCRRRRAKESRSSAPDGLKAGQLFSVSSSDGRSNGERPLLVRSRSRREEEEEEERRVLCGSRSSSTTNSQLSLTALPAPPPANPPPPSSRPARRKPSMREEETFPVLVPNNGDDSLRKCFQFFDELDLAFHSRFFRLLDVSDNEIKSREHLLYEDKIYALLNIWLEMKGRDASLNDLLRALLDLNQRRTAENIKDKALQCGHYTRQSLEGNH